MTRKSQHRKRGRPQFKPTPALRRKVSIAAGAGMSHEEIAIGLGIGTTTLQKYFEIELSEGAYARRLEVLESMHKAATGPKRSIAAARAYMALAPAIAAPPASQLPKDEPKPEPMGKKAQANEDATTAAVGTEWADLLPSGGKVVPIRA